jgi:hypothetical protein
MGAAERASLEDHTALLERLSPRLLPLATDTGLLVHRAVQPDPLMYEPQYAWTR